MVRLGKVSEKLSVFMRAEKVAIRRVKIKC